MYIGGNFNKAEPVPVGRSGLRGDRVRSWLRRAVRNEAGRGFLWLPVLICGGLITYYGLSYEPSVRTVAAGFGLAVVAASVFMWRGRVIAGVIIAVAAFGFVLGKLRTEVLETPVLASDTGTVTLGGWVEAVAFKSERRQRVLIRVTTLTPVPQSGLPRKLQISLSRAGGDLLPGWHVSFRARLFKPKRPVAPGAFDFARRDWFNGIGGTGYGFGEVKVERDAESRPFGLGIAGWLAEMRSRIASAVRDRLDGASSAFVVAVLTGLRGELPEESVEALRASGLAHLLAISGLHMGLVAFTLFWLCRALLAFSANLALRWPIKKWSAVVALVGAAGYLGLSGASVSTQRAFIMITIMFLAIIVERPAISMRNVALAALIILLLRPESVLNVSFQMSFLAVIGLVALVEFRSGRNGGSRLSAASGDLMWHIVHRVIFYFVSILLTTLVASLATAPVAAYQFHRVAAFGIVANIIAIPMMGIAIMPFALIATLLMPFGLEPVPLSVAGLGASAVLSTARWASELPGGHHHVAGFQGYALVLMVFGFLWVCLWQTSLRWAGAAFIAAGLAMTVFLVHPDVLVEQDGNVIAVRAESGNLVLSSAKRSRFAVERWLAADGDSATPEDAAARAGMLCDEEACSAASRTGRTVSFLFSPSALWEECRRADIVVATFAVNGKCASAALLIDRRALYREGAHAVYLSGEEVSVRTVSQWRGRRPWTTRRAKRLNSDE